MPFLTVLMFPVHRVEYVSLSPDGFRYRSQMFTSVNGLFRWFKDHYQEPIPGRSPPLRPPPPPRTPRVSAVLTLCPSPLSLKASPLATAAGPGRPYRSMLRRQTSISQVDKARTHFHFHTQCVHVSGLTLPLLVQTWRERSTPCPAT